jgi:HEAT repeat protein
MLYEMISGELPFIAKSSVALMMKHLTVPPPKLHKRFPKLGVPESVDEILGKLLGKEKEDRFPSMREVEAALSRELDRLLVQRGEKMVLTSATARQLTADGRRSRLLVAGRRVPLWALLPVAVLILIGGGLVALRLLSPKPPPVREQLAPAELLALRQRAVQLLLTDVREAPPDFKVSALAALGESRDAALRAPLEKALGDADPTVQAQAAEALGQLGDRAATARLGELLDQSKDSMVLAAAADALGALGDDRGSGTLAQLLREPSPDGQFRAALSLAESGNKEAQSKLLAYLARGNLTNHGRRLRVLGALLRGGEPSALPTLQRLMTAPGPVELRLGAARMLVQLGEESGRTFLREEVRKPGPDQLLAARLLATPEETDAVALLRRVMEDKRSVQTTRVLSAQGLGGGGDSLDARLLGTQFDPALLHELRQAAAIAVLAIAGRDPNTLSAQSLAWARGALSDRDWMVREAAAAALGDNDSADSLGMLTGAMRDPTARVRQAAVRSLGQRKTAAARDLLLAALGDSDSAVRLEVLRSLSRVVQALQQRGEQELPALQGLLGSVLASRPPLEQALAVGVLLRAGDAGQLGRLRALVQAKDNDPQVRRTAAEQLSAQAPEQAELLAEVLADPDFSVRFVAARKLAARGDKRAIPVLKEALARGGLDGLLAYVLLNKLGEPTPPPADLETSFAAAPLAQRLEVAELLGELPADVALPLLRRASRDLDAAVRRHVAEAAALLRGEGSVPPGVPLLRQLLTDRDGGVRARAQALLGRLLTPQDKAGPASPPTAAEVAPARDGGAGDGGVHTAGAAGSGDTAGTAAGSDDAALAGGRGHLLVETPPGVHFQIDRGPYQTATKAALTLPAGRHLVTAISGVQEVLIKPDTTVTLHIEASQAEQLFRDGRDNFNKPDYAKAKRQLEKANALCARDSKHAQACAGLTLESFFLLGKIYEEQNDLSQAMNAFQRVAEREANVRGKNEQKAYSQQAMARLRPKLGQVILTQKGKRGCQDEVNWLRPGTTLIRINGSLQAVTVKAGGEVRVGSCN